MATRTKEDYTWDPEAPMIPLFQAEANRRAYLQNKHPLTAAEAKELEEGYLPFAYVGCTYHGHPVGVVLLYDDSGDRTPFVLNDPNNWRLPIYQPMSTKHWPEGPPGWVALTAGVHFETATALATIHDRLHHLPLPHDVEFQTLMNEGPQG